MADYFSSRWRHLYWLAAALVLASVGCLGAYYETNDDGLITLLLRGQAAGAPVADLQLYFHGFARLWAALYKQWPALPWYGLTLYTLLAAAFMLLFAVLDRTARPRLRPGPRVLLLLVFYFIALLESALWFNFVRVALVLAGAGLLFALQRATDPAARRPALGVGLLAVLLAGLIRPSAALLGLLAVLPAVACLPVAEEAEHGKVVAVSVPAGKPNARPVRWVLSWFSGLLLTGTLALFLFPGSPETRYRRQLDSSLAQLNDYQLLRRQPATAADTLTLGGAHRWWLVGDSTVFNPALFQRTTRLDVGYFASQVLPAKLVATAQLLVRDYFPVLLALLWLAIHSALNPHLPSRLRWHQGLYHIGFMLLLLALGGLLKLPPRLAGPLLALFLTSQLAFALCYARAPRHWLRLLVLSAPVLLLYAAKTAHRVQILQREQRVRTNFMTQLQAQAGPRLVAAAGLETALKSLSPFQNVGPAQVLLLNGWPTLDASQPRFRQQLSERRDLSPAVQQLAADSSVVWLMPVAFVPFYNSYLRQATGLPASSLRFQLKSPFEQGADTALPVPVRPVPTAWR